MRCARLVWSGLCFAVLITVFIRLPGWDAGVDEPGSFSGAETFAAFVFVIGVVWLVGLSILAVLDDSLERERTDGATASRLLLRAFFTTVFVIGFGFAGLLIGGWLGDETCAKSGQPGDFFYGLECIQETFAGAVIGAVAGVAAGARTSVALRISAGGVTSSGAESECPARRRPSRRTP